MWHLLAYHTIDDTQNMLAVVILLQWMMKILFQRLFSFSFALGYLLTL